MVASLRDGACFLDGRDIGIYPVVPSIWMDAAGQQSCNCDRAFFSPRVSWFILLFLFILLSF